MENLKKPKTSSGLPVIVRAASSAPIANRSPYVSNAFAATEQFADDNDSEEGLVEYWRILVRNRRTIFFASLLGLAIGFCIGIPMKPVFRADTTLEVLTLNGDFMNLKQSNPTTTNDGNYDTSEEQTQAKLLESSALLKRVVAKLDPTTGSAEIKPPLAADGWRSWLHWRQPVLKSPRQLLLRQAAASVKVRPTSRTRVLEVTVDSTDPQLATDFANTLSQEFIAQNIEARWATTQTTSEWLQRELEDARAKLRASENALQNYASTSGLIFTDETTNVATEKLQQLQKSLSDATADRISKQSRYELAQSAPANSLGDVLNDASLRDTLGKINELKRQLADANTVFVPESTKVQRLQAELDSLQAAFDRQKTDIVAHIRNDFTEASRKEKLLESAYKTQTSEVTGQDEKAIQYNILKRDVDSNRSLYDTMLQQMKQASISSAIRAGNVRVVDPAELPDFPVSPNFKLNSAVGLFAGLFLSMAFVTLKERADRTLQQPGDVKLWTDVIELGVIPNASLNPGGVYSSRTLESVDSNRHKSRSKRSNGAIEPVELVTAQRQASMSSEAFRSTLTSMLFVSEESNRPKVMVFTSANASDGKTTVVSNIAIAAAEIRMKVLIIDADLRRPRMHSLFGLNNDFGLVDILTGSISEIDLSDLIKPTNIKNLSVLTAGTPSQAAAHLLYSPMWGAVLNKLRDEYDMILIDTPPMLQMTDARVAARAADAVVLVARSNKTTRDALIAAKDRLMEDRIPILGSILNDWNPKNSPGGYYGYYSRNHYEADYYDRAE